MSLYSKPLVAVAELRALCPDGCDSIRSADPQFLWHRETHMRVHPICAESYAVSAHTASAHSKHSVTVHAVVHFALTDVNRFRNTVRRSQEYDKQTEESLGRQVHTLVCAKQGGHPGQQSTSRCHRVSLTMRRQVPITLQYCP